jgi:hypothetical protein
MTQELITVVTGTLGDSCSHLSRVLTEMRQFTRLPFRQIVSDDGTADPDVKRRQRAVCEAHEAEWVENPGPTFGISYNLNYLFSQVKTPWAFLIEDATRPSMGWLETAMDALEKVGDRKWQGRTVSAIGMASSFEAWHMACAHALPTDDNIPEFFNPNDKPTFQRDYDAFWGSQNHPHWNDGFWCWQRMHDGCLRSCEDHAADNWPEIIRRTWRDPILRHEVGCMRMADVQNKWGWTAKSGWPRTRTVCTAPMGPSAWALHNLDAWRSIGGFGQGVTFYEGHIGVRYSRAGFLNVNCECPPWLHWSGLAFRVKDQQRGPRHHEPTEVPFMRDFGCDGHEHGDLGRYAQAQFRDGELDAISRELGEVQLHMVPGWERWL